MNREHTSPPDPAATEDDEAETERQYNEMICRRPERGQVGQAAPGAAAAKPGPAHNPSLPIGQRTAPQPDAGPPTDKYELGIELGADHEAGAVVLGFGVSVRTIRLPPEHADLLGRLILHKAAEVQAGRPDLGGRPPAHRQARRARRYARLHRLRLRKGWATLRVTIPAVFTGARAWLASLALRLACKLLRMNCQIERR